MWSREDNRDSRFEQAFGLWRLEVRLYYDRTPMRACGSLWLTGPAGRPEPGVATLGAVTERPIIGWSQIEFENEAEILRHFEGLAQRFVASLAWPSEVA